MERPSLPERPKATTLTVEDILQEARAGRLRVPRFQTGLRWGGTQVVELFDSILRGFPIGSLLLWEREADAEHLGFGPVVELDVPRTSAARFLVDGQQRVTALVGALLREEAEPTGDSHAVWIDLERGSFHRPRGRGDIEPTWVPVNLFGDRHRLLHWSRNRTDARVIDQAFEVESRLMKYAVPAYVVTDADERALRQIFSRTNRAGKQLSEVQVFDALFGREEQPRPFEEMAQALDLATGLGALPEGWLLRCVKAVGGFPSKHEFSEDSRPDPGLLNATRSALLRVIKFLQVETGFVHLQVLPYRFPLIVLASFFDAHPEPSPRSRTLLARWLWRGAVTGQHAASSQGAVSAHVGDVGDDENESVQRLLSRVAWPSGDMVLMPNALETWSARGAVTRLFAAALIDLGPSLPESECPLDLQVLCRELSEHGSAAIFQRIVGGNAPAEVLQAIANRVCLPSSVAPSALESASVEVLRTHAISEAAASALLQGDVEAFVHVRAETLNAHLIRLIRRYAATRGDRDRPPIAAILADASRM